MKIVTTNSILHEIHLLEYPIPLSPVRPLSSVTFFRVQWISGTERAIIDPAAGVKTTGKNSKNK